MRYNKVSSIMSEYKSFYRDLFSRCISFHLTHEKMLEIEREKLWNDHDYNKLPRWAKSYIRGYKDSYFCERIYEHLEWRNFYKGEYVFTKGMKDIDWSQIDRVKGGHFYKDTDIMFFGE